MSTKKKEMFNATVLFYPNKNPKMRFFALWYFCTLLIIWNIVGHTVLGFEQSWATPVVALIYGLALTFFLEIVDAVGKGRKMRFMAGGSAFVLFLAPAIIPSLACGMLLYANELLWPVIFAITVSIGSKVLLRAPVGNGRYQHIFNPSNFGVAVTLVVFHKHVGFAPPYHFTENLVGLWDWMLPVIVLITGIIVHAKFTGRLPLVAAWVIGFAAQGVIRALMSGTPLAVPFMPMTSAAFILFTLYMIPDPATTPIKPSRQVIFGFCVAFVYGVLQMLHIVFGLFFALIIVCALRGIFLHTNDLLRKYQAQRAAEPVPQKKVAAGA